MENLRDVFSAEWTHLRSLARGSSFVFVRQELPLDSQIGILNQSPKINLRSDRYRENPAKQRQKTRFSVQAYLLHLPTTSLEITVL